MYSCVMYVTFYTQSLCVNTLLLIYIVSYGMASFEANFILPFQIKVRVQPNAIAVINHIGLHVM